MDVEDAIASGLCDVMEDALISKGIAPPIAKELAQRACQPLVGAGIERVKSKAKTAKRKVSPYARKYKKAFAKVSKKFKLKNGSWRKGGFDRAVKEAHKLAKKMK